MNAKGNLGRERGRDWKYKRDYSVPGNECMRLLQTNLSAYLPYLLALWALYRCAYGVLMGLMDVGVTSIMRGPRGFVQCLWVRLHEL